METKICKSCQTPKPVSDFYRHKGFKDGLHCNCKPCEAAINNQRAAKRARDRGGIFDSEKTCSDCGIIKPSSDFFKSTKSKSGLSTYCKACSLARTSAWVEKNKDRAKANHRDWASRNQSHLRSYQAYWKASTSYDKAAADREYASKNRERYRKYRIEYKSTPRGRGVKNESHRRSLFNCPQATPQWADRKAIQDFYSSCPKGMHVDHIVPINGKAVCGLHVLENLQYLTKSENSKKWNRFESGA